MTAKRRLEANLWDIANTLRGEMSVEHLGYLPEPEEFYKNSVPAGEDLGQQRTGTTFTPRTYTSTGSA